MFQLESKEDLTPYLISCDWSGDMDEAGRKLEFVLMHDSDTPDVNLGDTVKLSYVDEPSQEVYGIFEGRIFARSRDSDSFTMEFTAFDSAIYLAKSRITKKYSHVTVADAIRQTVNDFGIPIGELPNLTAVCSFIADDISATEAIGQALAYQTAQDDKGYHIYMTEGKLHVACTNDRIVENYTIADGVNLMGSSASESIEDMVSKVVITGSTGEVKGTITSADADRYGIIQAVYKEDPKQDDMASAKAMLKTVAHDMSVRAMGNIQCIAGFSVMLEAEQMKGQFFIKSDRHHMENNQHTVELSLVFHKLEDGSERGNENPDYGVKP